MNQPFEESLKNIQEKQSSKMFSVQIIFFVSQKGIITKRANNNLLTIGPSKINIKIIQK